MSRLTGDQVLGLIVMKAAKPVAIAVLLISAVVIAMVQFGPYITFDHVGCWVTPGPSSFWHRTSAEPCKHIVRCDSAAQRIASAVPEAGSGRSSMTPTGIEYSFDLGNNHGLSLNCAFRDYRYLMSLKTEQINSAWRIRLLEPKQKNMLPHVAAAAAAFSWDFHTTSSTLNECKAKYDKECEPWRKLSRSGPYGYQCTGQTVNNRQVGINVYCSGFTIFSPEPWR